jgi:ribulose-5-phosphate 4-epimerase/fuculose-1-phosphate aldolase
MKHHGVVIAARSKEEAYERAVLLEEICRRNISGFEEKPEISEEDRTRQQVEIMDAVKSAYPLAAWVDTEAALLWSVKQHALGAQLDDMAQMIGKSIPSVGSDPGEVRKVLSEHNSVFVYGLGALVCGSDEEDTEALKILVDKAATCALHTENSGVSGKLGGFDCFLMHLVYQKKYSAKKNG